MLRKLSSVCAGTALCLSTALLPARLVSQTSSGPSAWVYVSSLIGTTGKSDSYGFIAASNGKLTASPGSPFAADLSSMAVNGLYLFGAPEGGSMIDTYRIQSNGSLSYAATTNASGPNKCSNAPSSVFLDHSGATLYDFYYWGDVYCSNNVYQAWNVVKSSGALTYDGSAGGSGFVVERAGGWSWFVVSQVSESRPGAPWFVVERSEGGVRSWSPTQATKTKASRGWGTRGCGESSRGPVIGRAHLLHFVGSTRAW